MKAANTRSLAELHIEKTPSSVSSFTCWYITNRIAYRRAVLSERLEQRVVAPHCKGDDLLKKRGVF